MATPITNTQPATPLAVASRKNQKNLLTGSQVAAFKGIELHTFLQRVTDSRGPRVVVHEFPYRDGAKVETLGRRPHKTSWDLTFTGTTWVEQMKTLVASIDANPAGLLVHPIYGQMAVVCEGFPQSLVDIPQALNTISFQLIFTEDQTDLGIVQEPSLASRQSDVVQAALAFLANTGG